jgi:ATP-binding cassette, subfamily B, bacterial
MTGDDSLSAADGQRKARAVLRQLLWPRRGAMVIVLALMVLQSVVSLGQPWLAGRFAGALLAHAPVGTWLSIWFVLILAQSAIGYAVGLRSQQIASRLIADGSARVFEQLQSLPVNWHAERRRGDVLALLIQDVQRLGWYVTHTLLPVLPLLLTSVGAMVMMVRIDLRIALAVAIALPLLFVGLRLVGRRLRPLGHDTVAAYAKKAAIAEQGLSMLAVVKAYSSEDAEAERFRIQSRHLSAMELREWRWQMAVTPVSRVLAAAGVLAMLWVASHGVAAGEISAEALVTLMLYGLLLTQPLSELAGVYGHTQSARASTKRLQDTFAAAPEDDQGTQAPEHVDGRICFEHVAFTHPGRSPLFDDLNLEIRPGETVAITGANGAGKSTLVHLLLRLMEVQGGRITLDGVNIRDLRLRSLRGHIGLVAQNVLLFNASVAENIAYGRVGATQSDIETAARAAQAHDFICQLPAGYDTVIGDMGIRLSGGQKQRISLARAMLRQPAILILDEATAMFDPEGERSFIADCQESFRQRTVLLITHRPASLALADRVLRLEDGQLTEVR